MGPSSPDDHDLYRGRVLGPYELLVAVGSGGMARVWAARHLGTNVIFALKMLMPHLAENAAFRTMFFDEARIASRIHHQNVARTFELVELDGILTLVMEWVDGSSLVRMLRPNSDDHDKAPSVALPIRHAVKIIAETCSGLHAAHELVDESGRPLAVVHRDVSPHNVLLTLDGHVKVTDFGVAKALGKSHRTIAGQVKGKLAYMSPEQLVGGGIDRRSDVFALGSVLYEATTGERPFQGEHDPQVMTAIIMGKFSPPSRVVRGYPHALEQIVMQALSVEPGQRFESALHLRRVLEEWLASSGPPIGPSQISLLLHERCGGELDARMSALAPNQPTPLPTTSDRLSHPDPASAMEVERRPPSGRAKQPIQASAVGAVIAALVGILLGLGVLVYVHDVRKQRRLTAVSTTAAFDASVDDDTSPDDATVDAAAPEIAIDDDFTVDVVEDASDVRKVTLRVPDGARLFVDGVALPEDTFQVDRPEARSIRVLVKSEAHEDALVTIEPSSPDEIAVAMAEHRKRRPKPPPAPPEPEPEPASTITMPPNPYE